MYIHVLPLYKYLNETLYGPVLAQRDVERLATTNGAVITLLVLEGIRIDTIRANQHEVVVQIRRRAGRDLEGFIAA